jgi:lipid II:glycine glycyltransferase (peptidoglycan interpeptide bridge formation enzyme)
VMPLTWNKKYGFYYLYQPAFTPQLGVFGKNTDEHLVKKFLDAIPSKFRLIEISLNAGNNFPAALNSYYPRVNYILDLNKSYELLWNGYRENHKRNIAKAMQLGCRVSKEVSIDEIIRLNDEQLNHISGTKPEDYPNFKKLYELLKSRKQAKVYGIIDSKNKILASAVFFFSHNRAYYIMVGNHPDGKTVGASHALIDTFIKDHAGKNLIFDFEGSDIHNLVFFYSGFAATEEIYPALKINRLPWYIRLLKK